MLEPHRATGRAPAPGSNLARPSAARANTRRRAAAGGLGLVLALTAALGAGACDRDAKTARASLGAHLGGAPVAPERPAVAADDLATARRYLEAALRVDPHNADARAALTALAPADVVARDTTSPFAAVGLGGAPDTGRSDTLVSARLAGVPPHVPPRGPAADAVDVPVLSADRSPPPTVVPLVVQSRPAPSASAPAASAVAVTGVAGGEVVASGPRTTDARPRAGDGAAAAPAGVAPHAPDGSGSGAGEAGGGEARAAAGVHAAVAEYASALEARDLARLAQVYPGMTDPQRRAWATFFGSVADLRARLDVDQLTVDGATARARVRGTYEYENLRPRRAERTPVSFKATLVREGAGWRVRAVE